MLCPEAVRRALLASEGSDMQSLMGDSLRSLRGDSLPSAGPPAPRSPAGGVDDLATGLLRLADADADAYADRLHDGVLQALVGARYATDAVARGGDPAMAREAVQDALVALRRAVWLLRPRVTCGLAAALEDLAAARVAAGLTAPVLELDPEVVSVLTRDAAAVAYRFVQTVLDESGAGAVQVRLERLDRLGALEVDGVVRNPAAWSLRAAVLGGGLVVGSDRLRLLLPLCEAGLHDDVLFPGVLPGNPLSDNRKAAP